MTKCDFCDKPMVGYTFQQANMYCEAHEGKALEVEAWLVAEHERVQQLIDDEASKTGNTPKE
jgi:hypothetical protein